MASSLESNRSRTCCRVSDELVHPMSGSTALGEACSKSSTHDLVLAVPDCIAVLAGLYMRAVVMNGGTLRLVSSIWHTGTSPAVKAVQPEGFGSARNSGRSGALRSTIGAHGAARHMTRNEIKLALKQMDDRGAYSLRVFLDNRTTVLAHQW